jgi:hypothetical protein
MAAVATAEPEQVRKYLADSFPVTARVMMSSPVRDLNSRDLTHGIRDPRQPRNQKLENNIVDDFVINCKLR